MDKLLHLDDLLVGGGVVAVTIAVGVLFDWPWALGLLGLAAIAAGIMLGLSHE